MNNNLGFDTYRFMWLERYIDHTATVKNVINRKFIFLMDFKFLLKEVI